MRFPLSRTIADVHFPEEVDSEYTTRCVLQDEVGERVVMMDT